MQTVQRTNRCWKKTTVLNCPAKSYFRVRPCLCGLAGLHHSMPLSLQGTQLATNAPCDRKISKEKQSHQGHHWSFCKIRTCNILQRRQGCKHHRREKAQEVFEKSLQKAATKAAHATLHEVHWSTTGLWQEQGDIGDTKTNEADAAKECNDQRNVGPKRHARHVLEHTWTINRYKPLFSNKISTHSTLDKALFVLGFYLLL